MDTYLSPSFLKYIIIIIFYKSYKINLYIKLIIFSKFQENNWVAQFHTFPFNTWDNVIRYCNGDWCITINYFSILTLFFLSTWQLELFCYTLCNWFSVFIIHVKMICSIEIVFNIFLSLGTLKRCKYQGFYIQGLNIKQISCPLYRTKNSVLQLSFETQSSYKYFVWLFVCLLFFFVLA